MRVVWCAPLPLAGDVDLFTRETYATGSVSSSYLAFVTVNASAAGWDIMSQVPSVMTPQLLPQYMYVMAMDVDSDGDCDVLRMGSRFITVMVQLNVLCRPGTHSVDGREPCVACPVTAPCPRAGTFTADLPHMSCGAGQSGVNATACGPCPPRTYGVGCGSVCSAAPGRYCGPTGDAACPSGAPCPAGQWSDGTSPGGVATGTACAPCPAGVFGAGGSTSPACSGACVGAAGRMCGPAATDALGVACPAGRFSNSSGAAECSLCPVGRYGNGTSAGSAACSGACVAAAGWVCGEGMTTPVGVPCPRGRFSATVGGTACAPCPAGRFGAGVGEASPNCTQACPAGSYSLAGATSCTECPGTTYGATAGATTYACTGGCYATPGRYCPRFATSNATVACPTGQYSVLGGGPASPASGAPVVSVCHLCPVGTFGNATGLNSSLCSGLCPAGLYSSSKGAFACVKVCALTAAICCFCYDVWTLFASRLCVCCVADGTARAVLYRVLRRASYNTAPNAVHARKALCCVGVHLLLARQCPKGRFGTTPGSVDDACQGLCPAGRYGSVDGETNPTCTGACVPSAGSYCGAGATSSAAVPCPVGRFSVSGSVGRCLPCNPGVWAALVVRAAVFERGMSFGVGEVLRVMPGIGVAVLFSRVLVCWLGPCVEIAL